MKVSAILIYNFEMVLQNVLIEMILIKQLIINNKNNYIIFYLKNI